MAELKNYEPSWRERIARFMSSLGGLKDETRRSAEVANTFVPALEALPPVGFATAANDAYRSNSTSGALGNAALAAMSVIPGASLARTGAKQAAGPVARFTRESAPGGMGHLPGYQNLSFADKLDHLKAQRSPLDQDEMMRAAGMEPGPSHIDTGIYGSQRNPVLSTSTPGVPDEASAEALGKFDGLMYAQDASPIHWTGGSSPGGRIGGGAFSADEVERMVGGGRLDDEAFEWAAATGDGATAQSRNASQIADDLGRPYTETGIGSVYPEVPWSKVPGTNIATQDLLAAVDNVPGMRESLDALASRGMGARATAADTALGLPMRQDILRFRDVFDREGLSGITRRIGRGEVGFPAVAAAGAFGLTHEDDTER